MLRQPQPLDDESLYQTNKTTGHTLDIIAEMDANIKNAMYLSIT